MWITLKFFIFFLKIREKSVFYPQTFVCYRKLRKLSTAYIMHKSKLLQNENKAFTVRKISARPISAADGQTDTSAFQARKSKRIE